MGCHLLVIKQVSEEQREVVRQTNDCLHNPPPDYVLISVRFGDTASGARFGSHDVPG